MHLPTQLLQYGADVHYVNAKLYTSGNTPVHDATRKQHEAMCELLMHYGASPFISNTAGRTCMDEAVAEGGANLLRRFEQSAIWRGTVAVKVGRRMQRCTHTLGALLLLGRGQA